VQLLEFSVYSVTQFLQKYMRQCRIGEEAASCRRTGGVRSRSLALAACLWLYLCARWAACVPVKVPCAVPPPLSLSRSLSDLPGCHCVGNSGEREHTHTKVSRKLRESKLVVNSLNLLLVRTLLSPLWALSLYSAQRDCVCCCLRVSIAYASRLVCVRVPVRVSARPGPLGACVCACVCQCASLCNNGHEFL